MKKSSMKFVVILLAACLCTASLFSGCSQSRDSSGNLSGQPGNNMDRTGGPAGNPSKDGGSSKNSDTRHSASASAKATDAEFASSFKTVKRNPIDEEFQYDLWLAANSAMEDEASGKTSEVTKDVSVSPLKQLSDKRNELVNKEGIHYTEVDSMMGFGTTTEYWIKNGKYKKVEEGKITIFSGDSYVEYDPSTKSGTRYPKEMQSAEITIQLNSMLPSLSASPYQQKEDQNIGGFDCSVFYLDIEIMGMKGNTLFVDKKTGMLIKYVVGDDKNGISNTVTEFESGNIDDGEFNVPKEIKVEEYKS